MPLPTLDKTYEFDLNNNVPAAVGSVTQDDANTDRKQLMFDIVASLIGGGPWTVPWTVVASCDSLTSGFDGPGTNRWASSANLIWGREANPKSWIVIENTGLNMQLCIECKIDNGQYEGGQIRVYASQTGFGAANGGSDGGTTTRPTAVDECQLRRGIFGSDGNWSGLANGSPRQYKWHIVASDDGEVWNVLIYFAAALVGFWRFEVPKNPPAGWASPLVLQMLGNDSDAGFVDQDAEVGVSSDGHICAVDSVRRANPARAGQEISTGNLSTITPVHPFSWGISGSGFVMCKNSNAAVHPITGNPLIYPVWWFTRATSMGPSRLGSAYDLWFKTNTAGGAAGDTYPSNPATPQFMVVGDNWIIPWDGVTTPLIT